MPHFTTYAERKQRLQAETSPETLALIEEVRIYLEKAHLDKKQLAVYTGYGEATLQSWLSCRYHEVAGTDKHLRKALRTFMDANPIEATPENQGTFYETENVATIRRWFEHCLGLKKGRGRMVCIYSGPGGQKTFITENLVAQFNREHLNTTRRPRAFHIYCSQDISAGQLVVKLCQAAGIAVGGMLQKNLAALRFTLRTSRSLFIFDEAQHLSVACLEIIRELNDLRPYFGVMLLGSHRLRQTFEQRAAEMEQWHSRLTDAIELPGIGEACARRIIEAELAAITPLNDRKIAGLIKSSYADDIYSREKAKYISARRLFRSIEQIVELAEAKLSTLPTQPTPGAIQ